MPSTRSQSENLEIPISSPERLLRVRRQIQYVPIPTQEPIQEEVEEPAMGEQPRPLKFYAIPSYEPHNSIAAPAIEANNFELKASLL